MTHSETMFKNISELEKAVVQCKKCDRLVSFREKVAKEKRKSYSTGIIGVNLFQDMVILMLGS